MQDARIDLDTLEALALLHFPGLNPRSALEISDALLPIMPGAYRGALSDRSAAVNVFAGILLHFSIVRGEEANLRDLSAYLNNPNRPHMRVFQDILNAEHDAAGLNAWVDGDGTSTKTHPAVATAVRCFLDVNDGDRSLILNIINSVLTPVAFITPARTSQPARGILAERLERANLPTLQDALRERGMIGKGTAAA